MQEPYAKGHSDWMVEKHDAFARVFTHHPLPNNPKYSVSHPADPWHVKKNYDQLLGILPEKSRPISWIAGNVTDLPGHHKRTKFLFYIKERENIGIDYYGKAVKFIEDKWDGLAPYKYTVINQNSSSPDYWTDVVADSYLAWTVPIYYGCTNLEKYFPKDSFIHIDINKPDESLQLITRIIKEDDWERRLPSLEKARNLILNRYQFFPHIAGLIKNQPRRMDSKVPIKIPAYKRSLKAIFYRLQYKIQKKLNFNIADL
jgi:hypothetical protein